jgi:hypothetical protein
MLLTLLSLSLLLLLLPQEMGHLGHSMVATVTVMAS